MHMNITTMCRYKHSHVRKDVRTFFDTFHSLEIGNFSCTYLLCESDSFIFHWQMENIDSDTIGSGTVATTELDYECNFYHLTMYFAAKCLCYVSIALRTMDIAIIKLNGLTSWHRQDCMPENHNTVSEHCA